MVLTYTFTNAQGCTANDTRTVTVVAPSAINAGPDVEVCHNTAAFNLVPVNAGGTWSGSASVSSAGVFTPSSAGVHNLVYTLSLGACTATDNVVVTVNALPSVNAGADLALCAGGSVSLSGSASSGETPYTPSWNNGSSLSATNIFNPAATPSSTTTYTLTVTDNNLCTSSDQVVVTVNALPVVDAGPNISVCNQPVATVLSGQLPAGGTWSGTGVSALGEFIPSGLGNYVLTYSFTNANGCSASDTRTVSVSAAPVISAGADQTLCLNDATVLLSAFSADAGTWSGPGIANAVTGLFNPADAGPGSHTITLTSGSGTCMVNDQLSVVVHALPVVVAGTSEVFCEDTPPAILSGASPPGGYWEGAGITNAVAGIFDPSGTPALYTVSYMYTDILTSCGDTALKSVEIAAVPQASFSTPALQCSGVPLALDNTSFGATSWLWTFDGGASLSGFEPDFNFTADGMHQIELTVSNAAGCSDTAGQDVEIISAPQADFSVSAVEGCSPVDVAFTNNSSGDYATYTWSLDGAVFNEFEPESYLLEALGADVWYPVTLVVGNMCGEDEAQEQVQVHPLPVAEFVPVVLSTQCSPVSVAFDNLASGNPDTFYWNFGNGTESGDEQPEAGIYTTDNTLAVFEIWLYVENACGTDSVVKELEVLPNQVSAAFMLSASAGCQPLEVSFTNAGTGATSINYEFGDAGTSSETDPVFSFNDDGLYNIVQIATDGCGADTAYASVEVLNTPQASVWADDPAVCVGVPVTVHAETQDAAETEWSFGNGNSSNNPEAEVTYATSGMFQLQFTAVAASGCSVIEELEVVVNPLPVAAFTADVTESCAPLDACIDNQSTGAISYNWSVDDGTTMSGVEPCVSFENNGDTPLLRTIEMTAWSVDGCSQSAMLQVEVLPVPSAAFALSQLTTCEAEPATEVVSVVVADTYAWSVDGALVSSVSEPQFEFSGPGSYAINLTTANAYGCSRDSTQVFEAFEPALALFEMEAAAACEGYPVVFNSLSPNAVDWYWDFGDGFLSNQPSVSHAYSDEGVYNVMLSVTTADGCTASIEMEESLQVWPLPEVDFEASLYVTPVYFATITFSANPDGMQAYEWDFGDGFTASNQHVEHTFVNTGEFPVVLEVTDSLGCAAQALHEIVITSEFSVYVPNSFTPNGDGLNDTFSPVLAATDALDSYELHIFNRWGEEVFFTKDPMEHWIGDVRDGDFYGGNGLYSYRLLMRVEGSSEMREVNGMITLIR